MKAAWVEDLLSLLPPFAFLVANRIRRRPPSDHFPWGYHRAVSLAYLAASLALLVMGTYLLIDSFMKLVTVEHPPIGTVEFFGEPIWLGWLMLAALVWSAVPAVILGRMKLKLAAELHDKVLYADAEMNRADWMTAAAAMVGVLGIGIGLWWADAAAAIVISVDIIRDGSGNVRLAAGDLMDRRPRTYDGSKPLPLMKEIEDELRTLLWVRQVRVRPREEGHVVAGEAFEEPADGNVRVADLEDLQHRIHDLDWRLHDVQVIPVESLD